MHQLRTKALSMNEEPLIRITEAARKVGISHSTLSRQIQRGQVRSHGGKVRLSEVFEDRANNIDNTIWQFRKKPARRTAEPAGYASASAVHTAQIADTADTANDMHYTAPGVALTPNLVRDL